MDLDTARRALYRRGAGDADLLEYERLSALRDVAEASVSARAERERPGERRLLLAVALGVAAVALVAAGVSVALRPPPHAHVAASPAPLHGAVFPLRFTSAEQQRVGALFAAAVSVQDPRSDQEERLGEALLDDARRSAGDGGLLADGLRTANSDPAVWTGGLAYGSAEVPEPEALNGPARFTLIVVRTARPVDWHGTVTRRSSAGRALPPIALDASAVDGDTQYAEIFAERGVTIVAVFIDVPRGVRYDLQVLEAQES